MVECMLYSYLEKSKETSMELCKLCAYASKQYQEGYSKCIELYRDKLLPDQYSKYFAFNQSYMAGLAFYHYANAEHTSKNCSQYYNCLLERDAALNKCKEICGKKISDDVIKQYNDNFNLLQKVKAEHGKSIVVTQAKIKLEQSSNGDAPKWVEYPVILLKEQYRKVAVEFYSCKEKAMGKVKDCLRKYEDDEKEFTQKYHGALPNSSKNIEAANFLYMDEKAKKITIDIEKTKEICDQNKLKDSSVVLKDSTLSLSQYVNEETIEDEKISSISMSINNTNKLLDQIEAKIESNYFKAVDKLLTKYSDNHGIITGTIIGEVEAAEVPYKNASDKFQSTVENRKKLLHNLRILGPVHNKDISYDKSIQENCTTLQSVSEAVIKLDTSELRTEISTQIDSISKKKEQATAKLDDREEMLEHYMSVVQFYNQRLNEQSKEIHSLTQAMKEKRIKQEEFKKEVTNDNSCKEFKEVTYDNNCKEERKDNAIDEVFA